jgi:hypothetical protein
VEYNTIKELVFCHLQGSVDSQLDAISLQGMKLNQERKPSLTRSHTDSNITYAGEEISEAQGSVCYITKDGDIDYQVVLKVCVQNLRYLTIAPWSVVSFLSEIFILFRSLAVRGPLSPWVSKCGAT